VTKQSNSLTA